MSHSPFSPLHCSAASLLESLRVLSSTEYKARLDSEHATDQLVQDAEQYIARVGDIFIRQSIKAGQLLQALLDNAIDDGGRRYIACVILATQGDKLLLQDVALAWLRHLLYPIIAAVNKQVVYSPKTQIGFADGTLNPVERAVRDQKALTSLLHRRENHRCPVTGLAPLGSELKPGEFYGDVRAAQIIHFVGNDWKLTQESLSSHHAAVTRDMIRNWCSTDLQRLRERDAISPCNSILLNGDVYFLLRNFVCWFESTGTDHEYTICSRGGVAFSGRKVSFLDHSKSDIPLPDPQYLAMHAAFAKALYDSGARKYIHNDSNEDEETGILSPDGTSDVGFLLSSLVLGGKVDVPAL